MNTLVEQAKVVLLPDVDIGGTNTAAEDATYWAPAHDARQYQRIYAQLRVGTFHATDDVDTCKLQQCTSAAGAGAKDLTTSGSGSAYDYDTDAPVDAVTNTVTFDLPTDLLDVKNGFYYVRLYAAETGDTGTDNVSGVIALYGARDRYAARGAAAVAGEIVYVVK
jgi:hypothetical protein